MPALQKRHAYWYGCRHKQSSFPAASIQVPARSRGRYLAPENPYQTTALRILYSSSARPESAGQRSDQRWVCLAAWSGRCDPQLRPCDAAVEPCAQPSATHQKLAARSLHAPGAGRCTTAAIARVALTLRAHPKLFRKVCVFRTYKENDLRPKASSFPASRIVYQQKLLPVRRSGYQPCTFIAALWARRVIINAAAIVESRRARPFQRKCNA